MKNIINSMRNFVVLLAISAYFVIPTASFAQLYYPLQITCYSNTSSAQSNTMITWVAAISGGNGNYNYTWSGTDGLTGNTNYVSRSYATSGVKTASLTVTSAGETRTASCGSVTITSISYGSLQVSCRPNTYSAQTNTSVNWAAYTTGGNGIYTYSWSGTDGLTGTSNSVFNYYTFEGSKTASVTVTSSDGQSASANCGTMNVYQTSNYYNYYPYNPYTYGALNGSCSANISSTQAGNTVNWSSSATGGNGIYTYYWNDGESNSTGQYLSKYYMYPGMKNMNLTITSNGQSITRQCSVYVLAGSNTFNTNYPLYPTQNYGIPNQVLAYNDPNPTLASVYLSDIPSTGLEDVMKGMLFVLALLTFSAVLAYTFLKRKEETQVVLVASSDMKKSASTKVSGDALMLESIINYAREKKVLLSTDAAIKIAKMEKLNGISFKNTINKLKGSDWKAIGEGDIK